MEMLPVPKSTIDELLQLNQTSEFIVLSNDLVERLAQRSLNDVTGGGTNPKVLKKIHKKTVQRREPK